MMEHTAVVHPSLGEGFGCQTLNLASARAIE
jgi:hypothetical protein